MFKRRIALFAICLAGLLVIFTVLGISAYALHITPAFASSIGLDHPAQTNPDVTIDNGVQVSSPSDQASPSNDSVQYMGSTCPAHSGAAASDAAY